MNAGEPQHATGTEPIDLRGFDDFGRFEGIRNRLAVTDRNELVRIIDWQDTTYYGKRILVVTDADPDSSLRGQLSWQIEETRLTPVHTETGSTLIGRLDRQQAIDQAERWRAARQEKQMEVDTARAHHQTRTARL